MTEALAQANDLKNQGNHAFRKGDIPAAIEYYSSALQSLPINKQNDESRQLSATLLSNQAMCRLKQYDVQSKSDQVLDAKKLLADCIADCSEGLQHLESQSSSISTDQMHNTKSKLLYRRAKAYYLSTMSQHDNREEIDTKLNSAAKDLLSLLSFDEGNKEAADLLRTIKKKYGLLGGGRSKVARALDYLRSGTAPNSASRNETQVTPLNCLRTMQASLADDPLSCSEEIGKNGGVPLLLSIARCGFQDADAAEHIQCRIASLHILSACCSHDVFIIKYGLRNTLPPATLAQIVEEESDSTEGSSDIVIAAVALLIRLIVHWDHREVMRFFAAKIEEDGTIVDNGVTIPHVPEVDGSSVCRVAIAALSWGSTRGDMSTTTPRAALDLLSAWTASDLDALDAASDACFDSSPSTSTSFKKAAHAKITPEDIRRMKPRQVAAHRKRESEYRTVNLQRAVQHISMFSNAETGGLNAMLELCARTDDHRLRRDVGLQIGRMLSLIEQEDDVKKLVAASLGCRDWKVKDGANNGGLETLTIEELDEKNEDDLEEKGGESLQALFTMMKRGQMTASLLLGKPEIGIWAMKHGWSSGNGVEELKQLASSGDSRAMSIVSELVSEASSVESARPLLADLVEEGTLDDLLVHPDADVRSGAASCAAKIGLASKALSEDEGEVIELLDVAIELVFNEDVLDASNTKSTTITSAETTSIDRGIEVISYLAQKTYVKNKLANGYKPKGAPQNRKTAIQQLVQVACAPNSGDAQMAFGLASIFNLLAVSIETLQKEAFIGKEITKEQYDQLQALGKTEEEKEIEAKKGEMEGDSPKSVTDRIQKLANVNVPRAIVKLLEGSNTDTTQQKLLEGMGRMASEPSVRGIMIQQGCLSACLQLDKGDKPNEEEKKILRLARSCVAKLLITTNPSILTVSQRSGSIGPLIKLVKDNDALDLMHFEALLSLTNLAGFGDETKNRIVAQKGIPIISYAMFSDHEMVRQAATEALCNMVGHPEMMQYLQKENNLKVWVAFAADYEENFLCARAAIGGLAMAIPDPAVCNTLIEVNNFSDMIRTLLECGQLELMHRVLVLITGLIEHGGAYRQAVISTGAGAFCKAYVASYLDGRKLKEFNFSPAEQGSFQAIVGLAKEVVTMLQS